MMSLLLTNTAQQATQKTVLSGGKLMYKQKIYKTKLDILTNGHLQLSFLSVAKTYISKRRIFDIFIKGLYLRTMINRIT